MSKDSLPDWEELLSAAARLQGILPDAVLVGGTAVALYAQHRRSQDADHVLTDLRERFDQILAQLESVAGWKTARIKKPVLILGSLDGIETGVRQLIRKEPLETAEHESQAGKIRIPTAKEILRIKAALILKRNATRDYVDFAALTDYLGELKSVEAFRCFDRLYRQSNEQSALQQLQVQLANPLPYDLEEQDLSQYKNLSSKWHQWSAIVNVCATIASSLLRSSNAE